MANAAPTADLMDNPPNVADIDWNQPAFVMTPEREAAMVRFGQGNNGSDVFSNDRALYGYIEASHHLVLPQSFHDDSEDKIRIHDATAPAVGGVRAMREADWPDIEVDVIGSMESVTGMLGGSREGTAYRNTHAYQYYEDSAMIRLITFMNYVMLRIGGLDSLNAFVAASLRGRWIQLGAYNVSASDTFQPYPETDIIDGDETGTVLERMVWLYDNSPDGMDPSLAIYNFLPGLAAEFFIEAMKEDTGVAFVVKNAEIFWAAAEFVVKARGHHWKEIYEALYLKFITSCFEGEYTWPPGLRFDVVFRVAIHPFGLRALPMMAAHFMVFGKVGNAGILRLSGGPNGMAVVTSTAAALRAMSGEAWYGRFRALFNDQIDLTEKFEAAILSNKYGFHMSANLYGAAKVTSVTIDSKSYTLQQMRDLTGGLACIAQGFVEAMRAAVESGGISGFSLQNVKALEKYAMNNPLITLRIKTLVLFAIEAVAESKSVSGAAQAALPMIKAADKADEKKE